MSRIKQTKLAFGIGSILLLLLCCLDFMETNRSKVYPFSSFELGFRSVPATQRRFKAEVLEIDLKTLPQPMDFHDYANKTGVTNWLRTRDFKYIAYLGLAIENASGIGRIENIRKSLEAKIFSKTHGKRIKYQLVSEIFDPVVFWKNRGIQTRSVLSTFEVIQ